MITLRRIFIFSIYFALFFTVGCKVDKPVCEGTNLVLPEPLEPQHETIISSLTPFLTWEYPELSCDPENFLVAISTIESSPQLWTDVVSGTTYGWSPDTPLLPGMMYAWTVRAFTSDDYGDETTPRFFYTGPMCTIYHLSQPELASPDSGAEVEYPVSSFTWKYPDPCLPEGYRMEIATDLDFTNIIFSEDTLTPSTLYYPSPDLVDCTDYFWRVKARAGPFYSAYSKTFNFFFDREDLCPANTPGSVRGTLWQDQCSIALDADLIPSPLPVGCVVNSYGVDADGIHQSQEPNLLNIVVKLSHGECPQEGTLSSIIDEHGNYMFSDLTPGIYCLHVDARQFLESGETGHWTLIAGDDEYNTYRNIFLPSGQTLTGQDFAWYQDTAQLLEAPDFLLEVPDFSFTPDLNANCRAGPDLAFDVVDVALRGTAYPLDGRNQDGSWVRIMLDAVKGCWVLTSSGTPAVDIFKVRVLLALPTPTTFVSCASYTDQLSCEVHPACVWKDSVPGALDYCTGK